MSEFIGVLEKYSKDQIFHCFNKTLRQLNISDNDRENVINILEEKYEGIKSLLTTENAVPQSGNHPSRSILGLSGPNQFTFFPDIMGKRILLLGEYHTVERVCSDATTHDSNVPEIQNWLVDIVKNAPPNEDIKVIGDKLPMCVDIFTETPYKEKSTCTDQDVKLVNFKSPLSAVYCKFHILEQSGHLPNLRHHQADVRVLKIYNPFISVEISMRNMPIDRHQTVISKLVTVYDKHKREILSYALMINGKNKKYYFNFIKYAYKLVGLKYNQDEIDVYHQDYFTLIKKELSKMDPSIDKPKFLNILLEIYMKGFDLFTSLLDFPMDMYILSRIFINFDKTKLRGPISCQTQDVQYVICHTGSAHTDIYRLFFENYFNINPTINIIQYGQCLKLDKPFDYFG